MVLTIENFRLHRSFKKSLLRFRSDKACAIHVDTAFEETIRSCANSQRDCAVGEAPSTWIRPEMVQAYCALHRAGFAHSVETWVNGKLVGGLYCVAIGRAVFGESMFSHQADASKIALAALVCFCRTHGIQFIDCQQNTGHLASLGAQEVPRAMFAGHVTTAAALPPPPWKFDDLYWNQLLPTASPPSAT